MLSIPTKIHSMADSPSKGTLDVARELLSHPLSFAQFLAKLPPKDRATAERRIGVLEAAADLNCANLWRRLACSLMTLAPFAAKLVGKQTLQVYIADGRYRMQVFALEDLQDGKFTVYCPDVLQEAMQVGLLAMDPLGEPDQYVVGASAERMLIQQLDKTSLHPGAHFKDLTGWNRKALRVTLPPVPSSAQVETVEQLCAIAAQHFVHSALPFVARATK
jgi:hypothetical protein